MLRVISELTVTCLKEAIIEFILNMLQITDSLQKYIKSKITYRLIMAQLL